MALQLLPQAPQFALSVVRLTHVVSHFVWSAGHCAAQVPLKQTWPAAQDAPQEPQCCTSLLVSTQVPLQFVAPAAQAQLPSVQLAPPEQVVPHAPQLEALVCRLTHAPPHAVVPAAHCARHWP